MRITIITCRFLRTKDVLLQHIRQLGVHHSFIANPLLCTHFYELAAFFSLFSFQKRCNLFFMFESIKEHRMKCIVDSIGRIFFGGGGGFSKSYMFPQDKACKWYLLEDFLIWALRKSFCEQKLCDVKNSQIFYLLFFFRRRRHLNQRLCFVYLLLCFVRDKPLKSATKHRL